MNVVSTHPPRRITTVVIFSLMAILGTIFFLIALSFYINVSHRISTMPTADGRVVDRDYSQSPIKKFFFAVVEFTTEDGQMIHAKPFDGKGTFIFDSEQVGDIVKVYYNRQDPYDMTLDDFGHIWFVPIFFTGWSIFVFVLSAVVYRKLSLRAKRRASQ